MYLLWTLLSCVVGGRNGIWIGDLTLEQLNPPSTFKLVLFMANKLFQTSCACGGSRPSDVVAAGACRQL